jgi:signal transduction histidine kinase
VTGSGVPAWWARRTIGFRITAVVTLAALIGLLLLARAAAAVLSGTLTGTVDAELRRALTPPAADLAAGRVPTTGGEPEVRVLDTTGRPLDGGTDTGLRPTDISRLRSGGGAYTERGGPTTRTDGYAVRTAWRWVGSVITTPDGSQRLVVAGTDLVGYVGLLGGSSSWLAVAALVLAGGVTVTTWVGVRWALRPVRRMRLAAAGLGEGARLPVPEAGDELRALAESMNGLLARRDAGARRLREFTGDAAHELRTPVTSIRLQAEVAVAHPDPDANAEVLADIVTETARLSQLLDDLLALARADAGERPPSSPVDLPALARAAGRRAAPARPEVDVLVTAPAPVTLVAVPGEVSRVLDNLLANAVRYARSVVRVAVLPAGPAARIVVDDDGPGIPPDQRDHVLHRFTRLDDDRARTGGGAGLGLALVAEVVHRDGGTITISTSPEGGARITLRWPSQPR